jgi:hypothetical protein
MVSCYVSDKCTYEQKTFIHSKVCVQPFYDEKNLILHSDGHSYCFLHLPTTDKFLERFREIIAKRISEGNLDFSGIYFPERFHCTKGMYDVFKSDADFKFASFPKGAFFANEFEGNLSFWHTHFISNVEFGEAKFSKEVRFTDTLFDADASFYRITLLDTGSIIFSRIITSSESTIGFYAQRELEGSININGKFDGNLEFVETWDLETLKRGKFQFSISGLFKNPERVLFRNLPLNPLSFVGVDSRKFNFSKVDILPSKLTIADKDVITTYRQIAENAENNNRFEEASNFRQLAFETERLQRKDKISEWWKGFFSSIFWSNFWKKIKTLPYDFAHFAYCWTSSYGESSRWAASVLLVVVLLIFPGVYMLNDFQTCSKDRPIAASLTVCESKDEEIRKNCTCRTDQITLTDAIVQSLTAATLQNVEYRKPLSVWGELWIILEKIFAPLQAALLALAIRRKFMR